MVAYDENLGARIRALMADREGVTERKMFGGLAFMVDDRMAVGVIGDELMVRVGPEAHAEALARPHVRPMDFSGRPMQGYVYVGPAGISADAELADWVGAGADYAATQPPRKRR
jgi:hypothetical protein